MHGMTDPKLSELTAAVVRHRDEREWKQFHTPKELAISLCIESAELLQLMQWHKAADLQNVIEEKRPHLQDELADVLFSVLLMAHELNLDLGQSFLDKLQKTAEKYPIDKSRGSPKKYTEL